MLKELIKKHLANVEAMRINDLTAILRQNPLNLQKVNHSIYQIEDLEVISQQE